MISGGLLVEIRWFGVVLRWEVGDFGWGSGGNWVVFIRFYSVCK